MLRPVCSKNGYGFILHVESNGTVKQDGLLGNNSNNRDRQLFYIEYEDGYYRFVPKFDQQYCIGASSSVSGSSVNAVSRNNNDIFQKWELITAYGNTESMDDPCQIVKQEIYYRSMSLGLPLNISQTDNTLKVTSDFGYTLQTRKRVLELGKFHLESGLSCGCPVREDLKDYLLPVYHGDLQDFLKVALDSRTDGVVEHHEVALVFLGVEQKTLHLTASDVGCAVEGTDIEIVPGSHVDSQRTAEVFQLVAVALCRCSRRGLV